MSEHWVYLNDRFCLESQAMIPIHDRGFLFGEGIFTTIRIDQGNCEFFSAHLQRLQQQTAELGMICPFISLELIHQLIQKNQADQGIWRLKIIVTAQTLLMTLIPYVKHSNESVHLTCFPQPVERPTAGLKSLAYLDCLRVKQFAEHSGFTDAILANSQGILLETGQSNIFYIFEEVCYVPDFALPYLKGVFLQMLLSDLNCPIQGVNWRLEQLPAQAAIYICNSMTHVRPVTAIDQQQWLRQERWEKHFQEITIQALQMNS